MKKKKISPFQRWHNDFLILRLGCYTAFDEAARQLIAAYPGDFTEADVERIVKRCDNLLYQKRLDKETGEMVFSTYRARIDELRAEFDRRQQEKLQAQPILRPPDRGAAIQAMFDEAREIKSEARAMLKRGAKKLERKDQREAGLAMIDSGKDLLKRGYDMELNAIKLSQDETSPKRTGFGAVLRKRSGTGASGGGGDGDGGDHSAEQVPQPDSKVEEELRLFFGEMPD